MNLVVRNHQPFMRGSLRNVSTQKNIDEFVKKYREDS